MKKFGLAAMLLILLTASSTVFAQTGKAGAIKQINAYCRAVDAFMGKNRAPQLVFADTSDYEANAKPRWRKFASEKALDKFREKTETYSIAYNWQKTGRLVKSNFTLFSPSGDWAEYVYHYFRPDGTLAKAESEMRTFNGDMIIIQDLYFDKSGKRLRKTIRFLDLQTKKPKKVTKNELRENYSGDVDYYKKVGKLPFAGLLAKR